MVNRSNSCPSSKAFRSQFSTRRESLHQWLVNFSHKSGIQKFVHGVLLASFLKELNMVVNMSHGVGSNSTRGSSRRCTDTREARVTASKQPIHGCFQVGKGKRQNLAQETSLGSGRTSSPCHTVGTAISSQKRLVGQRTSNDGEFESVANIGDASLN